VMRQMEIKGASMVETGNGPIFFFCKLLLFLFRYKMEIIRCRDKF
jgi:hypothetical protein